MNTYLNRTIISLRFVIPLIGLYFTTLLTYDLFHLLAELFSIFIAVGFFMLAWNARKITKNKFFIFLSIAYLTVSGFDLIHALTYKGMNIFPNTPVNIPTQFWIAGRYILAFAWLLSPYFLTRRKVRSEYILGFFGSISIFLLLSIVYWHIFPDSYIEGVGLTHFKKISEYIISLLFFLAYLNIRKMRDRFDPRIFNLITLTLIINIFSELCFSFYFNVFGLLNQIGHISKVIAYYCMYKAIIEIGLSHPYNLLFLDIKQKQKDLQRERNRLKTYLKIAHVIFVVIDANQKISLINQKGCEILGQPEDQIIGKNWFDSFVCAFDRNRVRDSFQQLLEGKTSKFEDGEYAVITANGEKRMIGWHNAVVRNEQGRITAILCSGEDITKRKWTETKLLESEQNFRKLFENKLNGLIYCKIITDDQNQPIDFRLLEVNDAFAESTGLKKSDIISKKSSQLQPILGEAMIKKIQILGDVALTGKETRFEVYQEHLNRWYSIYVYSPKTAFFIAIYTDITEAKAVEERKNEFLSIISHELKTPITAIKGFTQILIRHSEALQREKDKHVLEHIDQQSNHLTRLVNDLLDVGRIETGKLVIEKKKFDLYELANKVITTFDYIHSNHRITLKGAPGIEVIGDENRIEQVITNLIGNAIKYSTKDCRIIVAVEVNEGRAVLSIKDFGFGISKKDQLLIFDRFYRASEGQAKKTSGFGLGLYISSEIINRHKGAIWVKSTKGKGSTFYFSLPLSKEKIEISLKKNSTTAYLN